MLCKKYEELTIPERIERIGELVHIFQNDDESNDAITILLENAKERGILDNVIINPKTEL